MLLTGGVAIAFAAVFMLGGRFYALRSKFKGERSLLSFSAGMALAYVFVRVMPELNHAKDEFLKVTLIPHYFNGMIEYVVAMLGFLFFYTTDSLSKAARLAAAKDAPHPEFDLKMIGFTGYVCLISYLLVNNLERSALAAAAYAVAMGVHFLSFDQGFRRERGAGYARRGHLLLAGAALVGWGLGVTIPMPPNGLMLGFLSGGVIVNTAILELPTSANGKMWPFIAGALVYSILLIIIR